MSDHLLIAVTGGIAAYKVCEVVSTLAKGEREVRVVMTHHSQQFITPLTLATLSRHPVYTDADFWQPTHGRPLHIELGEWADLIVIAPLSAQTLAKLAHGFADNLLTNTILASTCPVLLAPAMNTDMWEQTTVHRNWQQLMGDRRYHSTPPEAGRLACDRVGMGRMAEPKDLLIHIESLLYTRGKRDLMGKHLLVTAGSTREHFDPVRFISNPSTGKMGISIGMAAFHRGATVTLIHGPLHDHELNVTGLNPIPVTNAKEMRQCVLDEFTQAHWTIMAAAVADMKPIHYTSHKLPKASLSNTIQLELVPDILTELSVLKQPHQLLIGFAAQTGDSITPALEKLRCKHLDVIVANAIDQPNCGFASDTNEAVLIGSRGHRHSIPLNSKLHLAHQLLDFIGQI